MQVLKQLAANGGIHSATLIKVDVSVYYIPVENFSSENHLFLSGYIPAEYDEERQ